MEAKKYRIENKTRDRSLNSSVSVIDAMLEPLKILKVLVEGLAANDQSGLWLTKMTGIPMVPRISPFDLVYLDKENRVQKSVELLPVGEFPPFKQPAVSALILPFRSVKASKTRLGDQLIFTEIEEARQEEKVDEIEESKPGEAGKQEEISKIEEAEKTGAAVEIEEVEEAEETQPEEPADEPQIVSAIEGGENESKQIELFAADDEPPSFELDGSSPEQQAETPQSDREIESPVKTADLSNSAGPVNLDSDDSDAVDSEEPVNEPVAVSVAAEPESEEKSAQHWIERSSLADGSPPSVALDFPAQSRLVTQDAGGKENEDSAARDAESEWMVSRFLRWLYPAAYEKDRRKGRRIPIPDLVAYDLSWDEPKPMEVVDVSATGVFLITEERWPSGSLVLLSLQREGPMETGTERRIQLHADPVRYGRNGVGLSFVLPTGMDPQLWERPPRDHLRCSEPEYVVQEFRLARALAFLGRISPPAQEELKGLLHDELSNVRVECVVNVALKAEGRLMFQFGGDRLLADPDTVIRIVHAASWADTDVVQDLWAGLLVASCTPDGCDKSNMVFIKLLGQLATIQTRILLAVCEKALTVGSGDQVSDGRIFSTSEELIQMTDTHDLLKIHRSIAQLAEFGLLEKSVRASFVSETEGATTTPTSLGLQMYARCLGHRNGK